MRIGPETVLPHRNRGFTLVELAIVMTIIGLLIGGVLKGQEMLNNARVTKTGAHFQSYKAAIYMFVDKYGTLPGDYALATARIPGCTTTNFCQDGDGDGHIGDGYLGWSTALASRQETFQVWKHLALTNLISGVVPSSNTTAWTGRAYGQSNPASAFSGGYELFFDFVMNSGGGGGGQNTAAHIIRISSAQPGRAARPAISAKYSAAIDRKFDNGDPNSGDIIADYGTHGNNDCKTYTSGVAAYRESNTAGACVLFYQMF